MTAYYSEIDPKKAAWLRWLIARKLIAAGDVDERDIREVKADELKRYTQHHFFAGIGGWSLAARLAGWDDARPISTGSCPCQPYSVVGLRKGEADPRDLWPAWWAIQKELGSAAIFGEQVAEAIEYGWLDRTLDDMDAAGYATRAVVLPACSVGAGHERERVFFMGDSDTSRLERYIGDEGTIIEKALANRHLPEADFRNHASVVTAFDGSHRLYKPKIPMLAHGLPSSLVRLYAEGFGDAIVPQVAAEVIRAFDQCVN